MQYSILRFRSYGIYISQLVRFAWASSKVDNFDENIRQTDLKPLDQGIRYKKILDKLSVIFRILFQKNNS